jgi:peptide/nickel transport system substrate-binding protein
MPKKRLFFALSVLFVASMLLVACGSGGNATNQNGNGGQVEAEDTPEPVDTGEIPWPTEREAPTFNYDEASRTGSWADRVVLVEEPSAEAAATRLAVGDIDVYAYTVADLGVLQTVEENPDLTYSQSVGSYNELLFNPAGPELNNGSFNPFADKRMREAMNMFVDREYIVQEILGGLGYEKFLPITGVFPDYARIADVAKAIEAEYAFNPEKAAEIMTEVLEELGAENVDGQWQYNGEQITLIMVIRTEDERMDYGDYISNLLDDFGFYVDRQYKTSAEASPIWLQSDPWDGLWHLYTGGWISNQIVRDQAANFQGFYTELGWPGNLLWEAMEPSQEFFDLADQLANNQFSSMEERADMLATIAPMAMQESNRIWLYDQTSFTPRRAEVEVTADLAAAVAGSRLWSYTLRRTGEVGGDFTVAMPSMLDNPFNPIAGSNWVYDAAIIRGASDWAVIFDPYTGLLLPQRLASGDLYVEEGLPVGQTYDWVNLEFVDGNTVPDDAWVDWDATSQTFITVGEKFPEGLTARAKVVCNYEDDLYETSIWHDGSHFSAADVVMFMIMQFDLAKEDSAIFDDGQVATLESWLAGDFRGWRIASVDPLVVEYYTDNYQLDAENHFTDQNCGWPEYTQGQSAWHTLALGIRAEGDQQLAFTTAKSTELEVEWTNYVGGPSLQILLDYLLLSIDESYIPYEPTLGQFITPEEAVARYNNLGQFFAYFGHFWVGNGPVFIQDIRPIEKTATLENFAQFPDLASKWSGYSEPKLAEVEIDGPGLVAAGDEVSFDVYVTFHGEDYLLSDIDNVKYLLFDATGALVEVGAAEAVSDGLFNVTLSAEQTADLESGASRLEVIVVPIVVSIPTLEAFEFVVE